MGRGPGPTSRGIVLVPLQATGRTTGGAADTTRRPVGVATAGVLKDDQNNNTTIGNHVVRLGTGANDNAIPGAQISADGKYVLMITNPGATQDFKTNTNTAFLLLENNSQVTVGMAIRPGAVFNVANDTVELVTGFLAFKFTPPSVTNFAVYNEGETTVSNSTNNTTDDHYVYVTLDGNLTVTTTPPNAGNAVASAANWAALAAQRRYPNSTSNNAFQTSWAYEDNTSKTSVTFNGVASNGDGSQYDDAGLSVTEYITDDIGLVIDTGEVTYATGIISLDNPIVGVLAQAPTSSVAFDGSFKNGAGEVTGGNSTGVITLIADVAANEDIPHSITGVTIGNQFIQNGSNIVNSPFSISYAIGENLEVTYSYKETIEEYNPVMLEINNEGDAVKIVPNADVTAITFT